MLASQFSDTARRTCFFSNGKKHLYVSEILTNTAKPNRKINSKPIGAASTRKPLPVAVSFGSAPGGGVGPPTALKMARSTLTKKPHVARPCRNFIKKKKKHCAKHEGLHMRGWLPAPKGKEAFALLKEASHLCRSREVEDHNMSR